MPSAALACTFKRSYSRALAENIEAFVFVYGKGVPWAFL